MTKSLLSDRVSFRACLRHEPSVLFAGVVLARSDTYCWTCWLDPGWRHAVFGERR